MCLPGTQELDLTAASSIHITRDESIVCSISLEMETEVLVWLLDKPQESQHLEQTPVLTFVLQLWILCSSRLWEYYSSYYAHIPVLLQINTSR